MTSPATEPDSALALGPSGLAAVVLVPGRGVAIATDHGVTIEERTDPVEVIGRLEAAGQPRWAFWDTSTPRLLVEYGVRLSRSWDVAAVHRLIFGGWRTDPAQSWAALSGLDLAGIPDTGQLDLLAAAGDDGGDPEQPCQRDGHLRPEWVGGGWQRSPERWGRWAETVLAAAVRQHQLLSALPVAVGPASPAHALATARSESAAELLCAELGHDGIPIERDTAERIIASFAGPRAVDAAEAEAIRNARDRTVLNLLPEGGVDLRSPGQVKAMLARIGIEVSDTRSWRLEVFAGAHPAVAALLRWRKAERFATTYGYDWLDRRVGPDGRLRGQWTGCDGGAGRMTASDGLHSLPSELRPAVRAEPGWRLVRADLGQIEPRVLAAVSGDRALAAATEADDLYAPVAERLGVQRATAKVAVLAAMYGQTSGTAGEALKGLESAYPTAMRYLRTAYEAGRGGRDIRTYGGRLLRMWPLADTVDEEQRRAATAGRGRFARNAVIQGAAAEFFKAWAATFRTRSRLGGLPAEIVLCLHDELLVHVPAEMADRAVELVHGCLAETAARWTGSATVRFVADVSVVERWSEAKG